MIKFGVQNLKKFNFNLVQFLSILICFAFVFAFTGCATVSNSSTLDYFSVLEENSFLYGTVPVKENYNLVKSTLSKNFPLEEKDLSRILPRCNHLYFSMYSSDNSVNAKKQKFQGIITGNFPISIFKSVLKKNKSIKQVTQGNLQYFQYDNLNFILLNKNLLLFSTGDMLSFYESFNRNLNSKTNKFSDSLLQDLDLFNSQNCVLYSDRVSDLLKLIPNNKINFPIEQMVFSFNDKIDGKSSNKNNLVCGELYFELKDSKFQRVASALFKILLPENILKFINDTTIYIPNVKFNLEKL